MTELQQVNFKRESAALFSETAKICSQHMNRTELEFANWNSEQLLSNRSVHRARLSTNCPSFTAANQVTLTRRVTGSTCCRSVQFSSCAVNDRTSLNAIVAYACLHTVQSVKHCQQLKNGYYDLRTCNTKETSIAVMICCRKTDISPPCFPFTFCYGITT